MTTTRTATPPQSGALILALLSHVFVLPIAGAFLPALAVEAGAGQGLDADTSLVVLGGVFVVLILALHALAWRIARGRGERRLAALIVGLAAASLAGLALFGVPSPLVAIVHGAGLLL